MSEPSRTRTALVYGAIVLAAVALFFAIRSVGERFSHASSTDTPSTGTAHTSHTVLHVLLALAAILIACRIAGAVFAKLKQPPVIGEVIAGILLGPSLLGHFFPEAQEFVFPRESTGYLSILAQIGVILYMFLVGLELNTALLRKHAHATAVISHTSIVVPFLCGSALALALFRDFAPPGVPFTAFALFLGVAMAITAFPVLARILTDHGLTRTPLGVLALSCAAIDDVTAWCLLAFVIGVAQANLGGAVQVIALTLTYIALMLIVARPLVSRFCRWYEENVLLRRKLLPWVFVALILSALATEAIGIHALFGAFVLGALIPHDSQLAQDLAHQLEHVVLSLLLPAFFAFTGLRTQIGLVQDVEQWLWVGGIILVATLGKFGGSYFAARLTGLDSHTSASLGVLMNTRGLMELIVLNIGLDLGVLSPTLFAMMVLMALATTLMTAPLLHLLRVSPPLINKADAAENSTASATSRIGAG